jgi:hypothetical protein
MFPSSIDHDNPGTSGPNSYMKFRANGLKSRNNYSLTESSNKEASLSTGAIAGLVGPHSQSFMQVSNHFDGHRGSVGGGIISTSGNVLRNYDSDSNLLADVRGNFHENSFIE